MKLSLYIVKTIAHSAISKPLDIIVVTHEYYWYLVLVYTGAGLTRDKTIQILCHAVDTSVPGAGVPDKS